MNWPFVSRVRFDNEREARRVQMIELAQANTRVEMQRHNLEEMRKIYAKDIDFYRAALALKDTRYDALLAKYEALANPQSARQPMQAVQRKPADEAVETIVARFGNSTRLRRDLQRYVMTERALPGYDDEREQKIADSVLHWTDPESDEAVA